MNEKSALAYRPDIDGLRAVAILMVVLFHLGIPGAGGGFIGVDVFFVISGFLITRILQEELAEGAFSFRNFWLRRVRRLFPTLSVVLAGTVLAGWLTLDGESFRRLGRQATSVMLFLGNVWTFRNVEDYWGPNAEGLHLLHCWSLAVEEQFYLIFPAVLVLLHRWVRRPNRWLWGMASVSFVACLPGPWRDPAATLYLPHARAWELLAGALLARHSMGLLGKPLGSAARASLGLLGVLLLLLGLGFVRNGVLFPGPATLLPVLGSVFVIAGGPGSWVSRWLGTSVPVYFGRISYEWYLWHWPVLAYVRVSGLEDCWVPLAISLILASLTYHGIERPVRQLAIGRVVVCIGLPAMGVFVLCCAAPRVLRHPVERLGQPQRWCDADLYPRGNPRALGCSVSGLVPTPFGGFAPATPIAPGPFHAVVLGDSHGRAILPGLDRAFRDLHWNYAAFTAAGAKPFLIPPGGSWTNYAALSWPADRRHALDHSIRSFFATSSVPVVVVVSRWSVYVRWEREELLDDIRRLRAIAPGSNFVFVGQPPELGFAVDGFYTGEVEVAPLTPMGEPYRARRDRGRVHGWLQQMVDEDPAVHFIGIAGLYEDGPRVRYREGLVLSYCDDDHLSVEGALRAAVVLREALREVARSSQHPVPLPGR